MTAKELENRVHELEAALMAAEAKASEQNIALLALLEVAIALNDAATPDEVLDTVSAASRTAGATAGQLWWVEQDADGNPGEVALAAEWRWPESGTVGVGKPLAAVPPPRSLWAQEPDEPTFIDDVCADGRLDPVECEALEAQGVRAWALLPLGFLGRWQGLLAFSWSEAHPFSNEERSYYRSLIAVASGAVANRRLLDTMAHPIEVRTHELAEKLEIISQQREAIAELSTPVLEIWEDILALPVVGMLDTRRSADMMDTLLAAIVGKRAKCVILDVTGVEIMDTKTADYLLRIARACGLLGSRCVLTGLRPAVAQTLVEIDADLSELRTLGNLREGLRDSLEYLGQLKRTRRPASA